MRLSISMIFKAGLIWGVVAILLAIISSVLAPLLPVVTGLTLATFAFTMAGVHYAAKSRGDLLSSGLGGALAGVVAAILLLLIRFVPVLNLPTPGGTPTDLIGALAVGLLAGAAGGLAFNAIVR
ncbi:MAG: hypothetical protein P8Z40_10035 [Chloroflexota bacterium]|jgi:hypothetical protein